MKIVFLGLLVAAVGAGVYYDFNKRQNTPSSTSKDLIVDKWKMDSLVVNKARDSSVKSHEGILNLVDSSLKKYKFEFRKDSLVLQTINGKTEDTSHYEFADSKNILIWSDKDSTKTKWNISKLDSTSLVVKDADSVVFYFQRMK